MKCDCRLYEIYDGRLRTAVKCLEGEAYILRIQFISGSILIDSLEADGTAWSDAEMIVDLDKEAGNMWLEGSDDFLGVYETYEEADRAADEYIDNY